MKNLVATLFIALVVSSTQAFAQVTPKKEFTVSISEKNISLKPGESKTYDITINRSKTYNKIAIEMLIGSTLPEGLSITFEDGKNPMINQKMVVTASPELIGFSKSIILKGKSSRTSKAVMLNLSVSGEVLTSN